jgi:zinc protease
VIVDGDPAASDRRLAAIQAVTAADVQRVARRLLPNDKAPWSIHYGPPAKGAAPRDPIVIAASVVTAPSGGAADVPVVTACRMPNASSRPRPARPYRPPLPIAPVT